MVLVAQAGHVGGGYALHFHNFGSDTFLSNDGQGNWTITTAGGGYGEIFYETRTAKPYGT